MSKTLWILLLMAPLAAGCRHAQAKTSPETPALEMPSPPPRDVEPIEVEAPPPVGLATEPAHNPPPRPRPSPPPARVEAPKAEPLKVEIPAIEAPKPPEEPPKPQTTLQMTPATAEVDVERTIRSALQRAAADLNRVDYRVLNADARNQYDQAKRWVQQADDYIRTKNLAFAKSIAEKAAAIAAQLAGR